MDYYRADQIEFDLKEDRSPVTEADLASDRFIREALRTNFDLPFVTEESGVDYSIRKSWTAYFVVDPLDGTKDFIAKNDEFTINIALIKNRKPVLGVVFAPALGELFYGEENKGAFLTKDGETFKLPTGKCEAPTLARSHFHDSDKIERFARLNSISGSTVTSSAIRPARLAQGVVNIYCGIGRPKEWDIAAGHVLIKESGCRIMDLKTKKEPVYNSPDNRVNHFLACAGEVDINSLRWETD